LLLAHKHLGGDLDLKYARETMRSIFMMWKRPVHIETTIDGRSRFYSYLANHEFVAKD
jgi:stage V sporulation protein R